MVQTSVTASTVRGTIVFGELVKAKIADNTGSDIMKSHVSNAFTLS